MQAWHLAGAQVSFVVQSERFVKPVTALMQELAGPQYTTRVIPCDVSSDAELDFAFSQLRDSGETGIDALLHAVAHAPKTALTPTLSSVTRSDFQAALNVSAYSLIGIAQRAVPLMPRGGSISALTFIGGDRVGGAWHQCTDACSRRYIRHRMLGCLGGRWHQAME